MSPNQSNEVELKNNHKSTEESKFEGKPIVKEPDLEEPDSDKLDLEGAEFDYNSELEEEFLFEDDPYFKDNFNARYNGEEYYLENKSLGAYKPGDILNGKRIENVLHSKCDMIVYRDEQGFNWVTSERRTKEQCQAETRYQSLYSRATHIKIQADYNRIISSLEHTFADAFSSEHATTEEVNERFKDIEKNIEVALKRDVKVISQSHCYQLYVDEHGKIVLNQRNEALNNTTMYKCLHKAQQLQTHSRHSLSERDYQYVFDQILCTLAHCLKLELAGESVDVDEAFKNDEALITNRLEAKLRVKFLGFCVGCSVATGAILAFLILLFPSQMVYFQCMLCALAGSFLSILQRHSKMLVSHLMSHIGLSIEAFSRICIGLLFGLFTFILSKSELALAAFENNIAAVFIFTFLAGFSERFAPDLFESVGNKQAKEKA